MKAAASMSAAKRRRLADAAEDCGAAAVADTDPPPTQRAAVAVPGEDPRAQDRELPFPGVVSIAFLGGTIERVRERCSGDFALVRQSRAALRLPPISDEVARHQVRDLVHPEILLATKPGMQGRTWFGQAPRTRTQAGAGVGTPHATRMSDDGRVAPAISVAH